MLSINTDINSIKIRNYLSDVTDRLNNSAKRLSTGQKLNSAKDDAAGLYISSGLTPRISALTIGINAAQTGKNISDIAQGAITNMQNAFLRIRDLSVQASSDYYTTEARTAMQDEINSLVDQITMTKEGCNFNGVELLATNSTTVATDVSGYTQLDSFTNLSTEEIGGVTFIKGLNTNDNQTYYFVDSAEKLMAINTDSDSLSKNYILMTDIDLSGIDPNGDGTGWVPIGTRIASGDFSGDFQGIFDGNGYCISNITINRPNEKIQGLFGATHHATVKNLTINNVNITAKDGIGSVCGTSDASLFENINVNLNGNLIVGSGGNVAGLVGYLGISEAYSDYVGIKNCHVQMDNSSSIQGSQGIGGVVGNVNGLSGPSYTAAQHAYIENCSVIMNNDSSVESNVEYTAGASPVGGIMGGGSVATYISNNYVKLDNGSYIYNNGWGMAGGVFGWSYFSNNVANNNYAIYTNGSYVKGTQAVGGAYGEPTNGWNNSFDTAFVFYDETSYAALIDEEWDEADSVAGWGMIDNSYSNKQFGYGSYELKDNDWFASEAAATALGNQFEFLEGNLYPTLKSNPEPVSDSNVLRIQTGFDDTTNSYLEVDLGFDLGRIVVDVSSSLSAVCSITVIDNYLSFLNDKQSIIGKDYNRLESAAQSNTLEIENMAGAKSIIVDADTAKENSEYIKTQILQNAATSLLAQTVNINSQIVLGLLTSL